MNEIKAEFDEKSMGEISGFTGELDPSSLLTPNSELTIDVGDSLEAHAELLTLNEIDDLSNEELKERLRESLGTIKKQDQNLQIAAELGQRLIESNNFLAAEYEDLSTRVKRLAPILMAITSMATNGETINIDERFFESGDLTLLQNLIKNNDANESNHPVDHNNLAMTVGQRNTILEKIRHLEENNADLHEKLEFAVSCLRESEEVSKTNMMILKDTNNELEMKLRKTLVELRRKEETHNETVRRLQGDLEALQHELSETCEAAMAIEEDRRRLLSQKREMQRETRSTELYENSKIKELQERIQRLEKENVRLTGSKIEAERKRDQARADAEEMSLKLIEMDQKVQEGYELAALCKEQEKVIVEMREQMEETVHLYDAAISELAYRGLPAPTRSPSYRLLKTITSTENLSLTSRSQENTADSEWALAKWVERSGHKVLEFDLYGVLNELNDLRQHSSEAYYDVRKNMDEAINFTLNQLPPGIIKGITSKVLDPIRYGDKTETMNNGRTSRSIFNPISYIPLIGSTSSQR